MNTFTPRMAPMAKTSKYMINNNFGGYNTCIAVDKKTGCVTPNCVGYAQARLLELTNAKAINWKFPACNAEDWYEAAQKNGLKVGQTPKLGAVICWISGNTHNSSDGCGHVAIVENITSDESIVVSESGYGAYEFKTEVIKKPYARTGYKLAGFIYCPVEFTQPTTTQPATSTIPNQYKVVNKDGKQIAAYTNKNLAIAFASNCGGFVLDSKTGQQIYPEQQQKKELNSKSYPDYVKGSNDYYRVRKTFADGSSAVGAWYVWSSAYNNWVAKKSQGYHVFDKDGNQLD